MSKERKNVGMNEINKWRNKQTNKQTNKVRKKEEKQEKKEKKNKRWGATNLISLLLMKFFATLYRKGL